MMIAAAVVSLSALWAWAQGNGKEVFRHAGFWPREELEKQLAEMGVK